MNASQLNLTRFLVFLFLFGGTHSVPGQRAPQDWTLEEVLTAVENANGGIEAIEQTTNIRVRGKVDTGSMAYEFLLLKKRPDKVRIKMMFKGRSVETGFNGITGWRRVSQGTSETTEQMTDAQFKSANLDVDFDGPLIGEAGPGVGRRLLGVERHGRVDYFIIEVRTASSVTRHYIDSRSFREWKTVRETTGSEDPGGETVTEYADYRRLGVIWLAYAVEKRYPDGRIEQITIESAELDPGLLDQVFDVPRDWAEGT